MISIDNCVAGYPPKSILDIAAHQERPAFEVIDAEGKAFRIYTNGWIEGFGSGCRIINRIPDHVAIGVMEAMAHPLPQTHEKEGAIYLGVVGV